MRRFRPQWRSWRRGDFGINCSGFLVWEMTYSRASKAEDKEKEREKRAEERFKSALVFTYF